MDKMVYVAMTGARHMMLAQTVNARLVTLPQLEAEMQSLQTAMRDDSTIDHDRQLVAELGDFVDIVADVNDRYSGSAVQPVEIRQHVTFACLVE